MAQLADLGHLLRRGAQRLLGRSACRPCSSVGGWLGAAAPPWRWLGRRGMAPAWRGSCGVGGTAARACAHAFASRGVAVEKAVAAAGTACLGGAAAAAAVPARAPERCRGATAQLGTSVGSLRWGSGGCSCNMLAGDAAYGWTQARVTSCLALQVYRPRLMMPRCGE